MCSDRERSCRMLDIKLNKKVTDSLLDDLEIYVIKIA